MQSVHFVDLGNPFVVRFRNGIERLEPEVQEDEFATVRASSEPAPKGVPFPFALGHCGLGSPIDVDGSLWVPVGFVPEHSDVINAADGFLTILTATDARLRTNGGLDLALWRAGDALNVRICA
jgi:hypothetical protein